MQSSLPVIQDPATDPVPVLSFGALWHVGTLQATDKRGWSYEGQGLSVSVHPADWTRIAHLGGSTWRFTRPGNGFLDYHALTDTQRATIATWGIESGYVEQRPVYTVTVTDEDGEEAGYLTFPTRAEAEDEADFRGEFADPSEAIRRVTALVATESFPDPTVHAGDINPDQVLAVLWTAVFRPDLDGVWWDDDYHPAALSCPRGVIHLTRITEWTVAADPEALGWGEQ